MAVEGTWDLRTSGSSPRSLCVYAARTDAAVSTNPFDVASQDTKHESSLVSVAIGTERGSLHSRTYSSPSGPTSPSRRRTPPQPPRETPRHLAPVDLNANLAGSVVSITKGNNAFLLLVDDSRRASAGDGAYAAHLVTLRTHGVSSTWSPLPSSSYLPRMSCATFHPSCGFVYAAGRTIGSLRLQSDHREDVRVGTLMLPSPGARSGQDAMEVTSKGHVAIVAVGNSFYAISTDNETDDSAGGDNMLKLMSFAHSSQVHPVIVKDAMDPSMNDDWSCLFLASGRECAIVDMQFNDSPRLLSSSPPRNGTVTVASPILAAAPQWPWIAVLTSDGLISIRSPSCMAIPLRTVEVGTRPNDYFVLRHLDPWMVAVSYSGSGKVLRCLHDSPQDLADRLMRLAIDAFGSNGFPRSELAEAVGASFTATSYVGPEPTAHARTLLRQYLEAVLGLVDFDGGGSSGWPTDTSLVVKRTHEGHFGAFEEAGSSVAARRMASTVSSSASPASIVTGTALLCLVCSQMTPPGASVANKAAKQCVNKVGVTFPGGTVPAPAVSLCESIADKLLREASKTISLLNVSSPATVSPTTNRASNASIHMDFVEAAVWLLRSCGKHERAIDILYERLQQNKAKDVHARSVGFWSPIKYESYTATHLSELWSSGEDEGCRLVLNSAVTRRLLESNAPLGLIVFTAAHPQNTSQWKIMVARDDPLGHPSYPLEVVELLKSVNPTVAYDSKDESASPNYVDSVRGDKIQLPLESGRALAVSYLESAIGILTGRPPAEDAFDTLPTDGKFEERIANLHDELSYLLLEGVIAERGPEGGDDDHDTALGEIYRRKLRCLLRWPNAKIRSERLLSSLPSSFLQEQALLLGRLGKHDDALRILYTDLHSLDLALEYCDDRFRTQQARFERGRSTHGSTHAGERSDTDCAYLPLVRVALESDPDHDRGTTAAIQVLALRRSSIDRAAALRLLPQNVPVSAVARPFLIPALVDSESQIRRLTVTAALLRAKYVSLKQQLTRAQIQAQSNLYAVPQLRSLSLGDPIHSSKPFKARPTHAVPSSFPMVMIVKHFFPRHLIIQAKVTNAAPHLEGQTLGDVAFVVAESSEEAIQPTLQVPLKVLPFKSTGSAWCVLTAAPHRIDGMAILTCELRYTVMAVDTATGAPLGFSGGSGRSYVEELQDLEVPAAHFS